MGFLFNKSPSNWKNQIKHTGVNVRLTMFGYVFKHKNKQNVLEALKVNGLKSYKKSTPVPTKSGCEYESTVVIPTCNIILWLLFLLILGLMFVLLFDKFVIQPKNISRQAFNQRM